MMSISYTTPVISDLSFNPPLPDSPAALSSDFFEKLKRLHFLGLELSRLSTLDQLYQQAIAVGREKLGIDRLGLFLVSGDREAFFGTFGTDRNGIVRDERGFAGKVKEDPFMLELLDSNRRTVYRLDAPLLDYWSAVGEGWNAMTAIWDRDELIGILAADNLITHAPLTTMTLELMNLYAETLGHLIARKRTEQVLRDAEGNNRRFVERLRDLHEVSMELAMVSDLWVLFRKAIELGRGRLGFDRIGLFLFDDQTQELVGTFGTDDHGNLRDERGFRQNIGNQPRLIEVLESRQFSKYWLETDLHDMGNPIGSGWNAMAMLWDGDRGIGWLACDNLLRREPFRPDQIELLTLYGATLGHLIARRRAEDARVELAIDHEKLVMLRTFVANISHDFKTPLAVLNTSLYLLEHTDDELQRRRRIEIMQRHIEYLNRLIQDLLMMSRLEVLPPQSAGDINLNRLIEQSLVNFQTAIERKRLQMVFQRDDTLPTIRGSQQELYRAVVNLIENAVNFTSEGGTITVRTFADSTHAHLQVSDTGIGIGAADLAHIFDHYYRGDVANTYAQTGTGLGLAIVKRVTELHNGTITVSSEIGVGTTFDVALPLVPAELPRKPTTPPIV